jgi:hypothetical protein
LPKNCPEEDAPSCPPGHSRRGGIQAPYFQKWWGFKMKLSGIKLAVIAVGFLQSAAGFAKSHEVSRQKIEAMLKRAEQVVVATPSDVTSAFETNAYNDKLIVTRSNIRVEEAIKGKADKILSYVVEGGRVGELELSVSHSPEPPQAGQRVLLMLTRSSQKAAHVPVDEDAALELDGERIKGSDLTLQDVRRLAGGRK